MQKADAVGISAQDVRLRLWGRFHCETYVNNSSVFNAMVPMVKIAMAFSASV